MQSSTPGRTSPVAGLLVLAGGALTAVGSLLSWFEVRADLSSIGQPVQTESVKGLDTSDGGILIWVGVGLVVLGVALLFLRQRGGRIGLSVLALLAGAFAGGVGLYDALTPKTQAIDEASKGLSGVGVQQAKQFLEGLFDDGILKITVQIGLWLVVVGGAVALIGALVGLFMRSRVPVAPAAAPTGFATEPQTPAPAVSSSWAQPEASGPPPMPAPPAPEPPAPSPGGASEESP